MVRTWWIMKHELMTECFRIQSSTGKWKPDKILPSYLFTQYLQEAAVSRCSKKYVFLNIRKFHRKTFVPSSFFNGPATLFKKWLCDKCFSVNFVKFFSTRFEQSTSGRLLLTCTRLSSDSAQSFHKTIINDCL